jgi:hypothetical protein
MGRDRARSQNQSRDPHSPTFAREPHACRGSAGEAVGAPADFGGAGQVGSRVRVWDNGSVGGHDPGRQRIKHDVLAGYVSAAAAETTSRCNSNRLAFSSALSFDLKLRNLAKFVHLD